MRWDLVGGFEKTFIRRCDGSDRLVPENHDLTFTRLLVLGGLLISPGVVRFLRSRLFRVHVWSTFANHRRRTAYPHMLPTVQFAL